ncbi:MAG: DUF4440 domain-containing protein [Comamonadaceae bacterium]|nr:MAG: DUF4440 domain-containing protein [Comamonadaceae bacterium]
MGSSLNLPGPVADYFAADRLGDAAAVAACFAPHAAVHDEGRTHRGRAAIQAWKAEASTQYTYRVEPLALSRADGTEIVLGRVVGNFPGSPVELRYRFRLEGGSILSLEIAA